MVGEKGTREDQRRPELVQQPGRLHVVPQRLQPGGASARARSVTSRAGSACCCSWFEWTPAYPSCAAPSEARSVGASVEVGASADLRHMHNATVKRPAFRRIWAGVGETWGGRRVLL